MSAFAYKECCSCYLEAVLSEFIIRIVLVVFTVFDDDGADGAEELAKSVTHGSADRSNSLNVGAQLVLFRR
jgi:hypothetical protein